MSFLFDRNKGRNLLRSTSFRITQEGTAKVQGSFPTDPKGRILLALEMEGSLNINEVAKVSGLNPGQVERLIGSLESNGYVQRIGIRDD